jgi:general secretion pathway protein K
MKVTLHSSRRAFAVLMVMVVVTVLSILAGALAVFLKVESQLAANANDSEKLLWAGRAGVDRACWILANEPGGPTSLKQIWAGGPGVGPETNSPLMGISLTGYPVGDCTVDISMVEQESKFNVNTADDQLLRQILTAMGAKPDEISTVADSIRDWIDGDDATKPAGAESDYYQGQIPPYFAKDAPVDDIEELQLVKGVSPLVFKGGSVADPSIPFKRHKLGFNAGPGPSEDLLFGLRDVLTPYSSGKVNINTVSSNVLACIPEMDGATVEAILNLRDSAGDTLTGDGVLRDLNMLQSVVPNPAAMQQLQRYCTVQGNTYEVTITARAGANSREFVAVVIRSDRNRVQVVGFHPK